MTTLETLTYSDYELRRVRPSQYVQDLLITEVVGFQCPRCKKQHPTLPSKPIVIIGEGPQFTCECGLNIWRYGNAIDIWEDRKE